MKTLKKLHFDLSAGVSGDMLVASLLDLNLSHVKLNKKLEPCLPKFSTECRESSTHSLRGLRLEVSSLEEDSPHRNLADVALIIQNAPLSAYVQNNSIQVFELIAKAEAKVHGCEVDAVHFHEVGAVDSLFDVIAFFICLEDLGIPQISASPIALGSGHVQTQHGLMPVPAPATLELMRGIPSTSLAVGREIATPTGVALIRQCASFTAAPGGQIDRIGIGMGGRQALPSEPPNIVRTWIYEELESSPDYITEELVQLSSHIDTLTGEEMGFLTEELLNAGALDAYSSPTWQKKSRPGHHLFVLCNKEVEPKIIDLLFCQSTSLGLRRQLVERLSLKRWQQEAHLSGQLIRVKCASYKGRTIHIAPEHDDLAKAARALAKPIQQLRNELLASFKAEPS